MAPEMRSLKHHIVAPMRPRNTKLSGGQTDTPTRLRQLVEAAEDIFLAKGYYSTTMSDVARAAGISKKTVYQIIESKAELFTALLEHRQESIVIPTVQKDWSVNEILAQNLLCLAKFLLSPNQISIVRLIMAEYTHGKDFGRLFHQKRVSKAKFLLEDCLKQIGPPLYKKLGDAKEMSAMLFGMALGEFHLGVLIGFRPMPTKAVLNRHIRLAVEIFLHAHEAK